MNKVIYKGETYDVVATEIDQNYLDVELKVLIEKEDTDEQIWVAETEIKNII